MELPVIARLLGAQRPQKCFRNVWELAFLKHFGFLLSTFDGDKPCPVKYAPILPLWILS